MTLRIAAIAIALTTAACSNNPPETGSGPTIADSSGVVIVTNRSERWTEGTTWRISETPVLEIGKVDGEPGDLFRRIGGVLRLPDGSIVAATSVEVRLYNQDGVHLRTEGRQGEGPGEYEYIREIMGCRPGHFNVYDLSWRQSTYTHDGDFVETRQVLPTGPRPYTVRCTPSGTFVSLLWAARAYEIPIGLFDTESHMLVGDAVAGVDTILTLPAGQRIGNEHGSRPHPFGTVTSFGTVGDGIAITTGEDHEYRVYDFQGELQRIVRMPGQDRTIRSEDVDAQARKDAQRQPPELFNAYFEEYRSIEMTDRYPAYSELIVDSESHIWLRHHTRPLDSAQTWDVADPEGVLLGSLQFDSGVEIKQIGSDFILGHRITGEGVPQVAMWGLSRGD